MAPLAELQPEGVFLAGQSCRGIYPGVLGYKRKVRQSRGDPGHGDSGNRQNRC